MRPESGPMEFEDDWRGIFIRGDDALMGFLPTLMMIKEHRLKEEDLMFHMQLDNLINFLQSAHQQANSEVQHMKKFSDCKRVKLPVNQEVSTPETGK